MTRVLFMFALVAALAAMPLQAAVTYVSGLSEVAFADGVCDTCDDPDFSSQAAGPLVAYTPSGFDPGSGFGPANLNDGDVGVGVGSDGTYYIPGFTTTSGSFTLNFVGGAVTIGEIEVHMGYANRDDGTYTIKDAAGTTRGVFSIAEPQYGGGGNHLNADLFLASFDSPFTTTAVTIEFVVATASGDASTSFREIQLFEVPEPTSLALLAGGAYLTLLRRKRR